MGLSVEAVTAISSDQAADVIGGNSGVIKRLRNPMIGSALCDLHELQNDLERCVKAGMGKHDNNHDHVFQLAYLVSFVLDKGWDRFVRFLDGLVKEGKIDKKRREEVVSKLQVALISRWWTMSSAFKLIAKSR